jgi:RNA methyltransferase, TrmH family
LRRRSVRQAEGFFVVEGPTLLGSALDAGASVESMYVGCGAGDRPEVAPLVERAMSAGARLYELGPGVLERVAETATPQPVLAVVRQPDSVSEASLEGATFVVVCVDVRDPGNAGAVIRTADAAGADAVVCCRGTADPFNPKTVRASAGSVLHLPVVSAGPPGEVLEDLSRRGLRRIGALSHGGRSHSELDLRVPLALVLGNEASGLAGDLMAEIDETVTIGLGGRAESLNVASAAAVLCFEVRRQRSTPNLRAVEDDQ